MLAILALAGSVPAGLSAADAATNPVDVFPIPGSQVASPNAQIVFRGVSANQLGASTLVVTGSSSGPHAGHFAFDSDGQGGSFLPNTPFAPGEIVTVNTGLSVASVNNGTFQFKIATPGGPIPLGQLAPLSRAPGDVWRYRSRLDLAPAAVNVFTRSSKAARSDIFLAPLHGPVQDGPMILDSGGGLVWFSRLPHGEAAADFRVQSYRGKPVLTWWQGNLNSQGEGVGEGVIADSSYRRIAVVQAANGLSADLHEFQLTGHGTALIVSNFPVFWNASAAGGAAIQVVLDSVVQEIDIPTGLVLFEWDSLDHVPVEATEGKPPKGPHSLFDYFHVNSVDQDGDGNLLISARNTWAAYKVDHGTGAISWELGGRHSSFNMGPGASFAFQHDVRVRAPGDSVISLFDDGAGPPRVHRQSRGLILRLDFQHMTATEIAQYEHRPALSTNFEGNDQQLHNGHQLLGWGQQPFLTEFTAGGRVVFDAGFVGGNTNYRAYRFRWTGTPTNQPAVAVSGSKTLTVYASWDGATKVASWRVIADGSPKTLRATRRVRKTGFETATRIRRQRYVAVQAIDNHGHVLATSPTVTAP